MRRLIPVALLALAAGALLAPDHSTLAVHEPICLNAINSGNYNVVVPPLGAVGVMLNGTSGPDVIIGTAADDTLRGGSGNDVICGRGGSDDIDGGSGNDYLIGDVGDGLGGDPGIPGVDAISGGSGVDRLWGDAENDSLAAGSGSDTVINGGAGTDRCNGRSGSNAAFAMCEPA